MKLVIDPGHTGQSDPGAVAGGLREADVVLDVALRLRELLAGTPGFEVRLTRERNADPVQPWSQAADLAQRARTANAWGADAYLSIHVNAAENLQAHGVETYHHPEASETSRRLAQTVHRHLVPLFRADRGVRQADFAVLRLTRCPAVLVELGFVTNSEDRRQLADPAFRQRLAEALAAGLREGLGLPAPAPAGSGVAPAPILERPVTVAVGDRQVAGYVGSDGRTWVPVREIAEALGAQVEWRDGSVSIAVATKSKRR